jgi:putative endonuclease
MEERRYWVYILVSASGNAMYIGVTNNLEKRLHEHRTGKGSEFAKKYRASKLVYAEEYETPADAIAREKQLKGWRRERKNELVRTINPQFRELLPAQPWPTSPALQASGPSPSAQDDWVNEVPRSFSK